MTEKMPACAMPSSALTCQRFSQATNELPKQPPKHWSRAHNIERTDADRSPPSRLATQLDFAGLSAHTSFIHHNQTAMSRTPCMAHIITTPDDRIAKLMAAGVPEKFLCALDNPDELEDFQYIIQFPEASYHYLPSIIDSHGFLQNQEITPICNSINGDIHYAMLSWNSSPKFVGFYLESNETYEDFGSDFMVLLASLLIDLYECSDQPLGYLTDIGERVGFSNSEALFQALEAANTSGKRCTVESDDEWRKQYLHCIIGSRTSQ